MRALAPEVLQAARNVPSVPRADFYIQTAVLLACARIGDPSDIAYLKQAAPHLDPHLKKELLPVVLARIEVESQLPHPRTAAEWQEKSTLFLKRAGVSMSAVPTVLGQYSDSCRHWPSDNILAQVACAYQQNGLILVDVKDSLDALDELRNRVADARLTEFAEVGEVFAETVQRRYQSSVPPLARRRFPLHLRADPTEP